MLTDPIPANTTYTPGSLQSTAGANIGAKTDTATDDDQAEYDSLSNRVVFRLGTGATGTAGGTLAPTNSTTLKFRVQVNGSTPNSTTVSNQATVAYRAQTLGTDFTAQSDGDAATSGVQPTNIIVTLPDMAIAKSHTGNFNQGQSSTYNITATNLGPGTTAGTVTVSDTLPAGLTPTAATGTGWICTVNGQVVTCTRADAIAANTSYSPITLTVNVAPTAPVSLTNIATVSGGGQTNTANDSANDPTTIDSSASVPPNLLLVKRITAINNVDVAGFQDGVNTPGNPNNVGTKAVEDNNALWPAPNAPSLRGAINSSTIAPTISLKPGDEVEYTIYFLNNGAAQANNVSVCDFVPANQTYVATGYNSSSFGVDTGGLAGSNYGVAIQSANGATPVKATNAGDGDRGPIL